MTFEEYWTRISRHLLDAANDAHGYLSAVLTSLEDVDSGLAADMKDKAQRGWDEHDGEIQYWSVDQCDDAAYEEVMDLIVYLATATAIESGDLL